VLISTITVVAPDGEQVVLGANSVPGYTLESVSLDPAPIAVVRRDLPAVTGGVVLPGRRDVRIVELSGIILAPSATAAHAMRRTLVRVFGDHGKDALRLAYQPENVEVELRGYTDGAPTFTDLGGNLLRFQVSIICPDPVALSTETQTVPVPVGGATASAAHYGDADVWPVITITAVGSLTGVTVSNAAAGGKAFTLTGLSVAAGQQIVIITTPGRESVKAGGVSVMDKRTTSSRFWAIKPGSNQLSASYTGSGSAPLVSVTYREGWVS
jgi:hypothetical protein